MVETIFNALNKNKKYEVRGREIVKDVDVTESVMKIMKEKGIKLKDRKSRKISKKDVEWANLIVIVADNLGVDIKEKEVIR